MIQSNKVRRPFRNEDQLFIQRKDHSASSAFGPQMAARGIHQDLPHHAGSHGKKVRPVLPLKTCLAGKLQISLIDQGRRLQRMSRPLTSEQIRSHAPEVFINEWGKCVQGIVIAAGPTNQDFSNLRGIRAFHFACDLSATGSISSCCVLVLPTAQTLQIFSLPAGYSTETGYADSLPSDGGYDDGFSRVMALLLSRALDLPGGELWALLLTLWRL